MMDAQAILTVWLLIQLPVGLCRNVRLCKLENKTERQLMGGQIGTTFRFVGMFACLYFGGFYN
jgi:uncharacterized membrane protein